MCQNDMESTTLKESETQKKRLIFTPLSKTHNVPAIIGNDSFSMDKHPANQLFYMIRNEYTCLDCALQSCAGTDYEEHVRIQSQRLLQEMIQLVQWDQPEFDMASGIQHL